jgi:hypothetical protein
VLVCFNVLIIVFGICFVVRELGAVGGGTTEEEEEEEEAALPTDGSSVAATTPEPSPGTTLVNVMPS